MKKELQMRLAIAGFLQETLQEMASKRGNSSEAKEVLYFRTILKFHVLRFNLNRDHLNERCQ